MRNQVASKPLARHEFIPFHVPQIDEEEIRSVVERERDELRATARGMQRVGAHDRARELLRQADVLDGYLVAC